MDAMNKMTLYRAHMARKEAQRQILARPVAQYNPEAFTSITLDHELKWIGFFEHDDSLTDEEYERYSAWQQRYLDKWF